MSDIRQTLPAAYYTDPSHFAHEQARFFGDMWVCVARVEDLATPGDYVLRDRAWSTPRAILVPSRAMRALCRTADTGCRNCCRSTSSCGPRMSS